MVPVTFSLMVLHLLAQLMLFDLHFLWSVFNSLQLKPLWFVVTVVWFSCVVYRYVRAEVVAGFVNTLFLLFVAFFIFAEAIEVRKITHHKPQSNMCAQQ